MWSRALVATRPVSRWGFPANDAKDIRKACRDLCGDCFVAIREIDFLLRTYRPVNRLLPTRANAVSLEVFPFDSAISPSGVSRLSFRSSIYNIGFARLEIKEKLHLFIFYPPGDSPLITCEYNPHAESKDKPINPP